jgi:mono/diheme cytochrome c family protein
LPRRLALLAAAALAAGACSAEHWPDPLRRVPGPDDAVALVPWFSTMHRGLAVQPYKWPTPRPPVPGTIPVQGAEPPQTVIPANYQAINALVNPAARTAESLEAGKVAYDIFCLPCHGAEGRGDGPVNELLRVAPSLLTQQARDYTDGYLYAVVRHGRGLMPAYGDRILPETRWHVVNYVRLLQNRGGTP